MFNEEVKSKYKQKIVCIGDMKIKMDEILLDYLDPNFYMDCIVKSRELDQYKLQMGA